MVKWGGFICCHSADPVASRTGSTLMDEWRDHGNEKLRGEGGGLVSVMGSNHL